ncbi:MAG: hypothetical protein IJS01_02065 [Lentisphaeria bacterium]|nr:hypothetical protein [Lentisphaeria bacterium]
MGRFSVVGAAVFAAGLTALFAAPPHSWDKKPDSYFWYVKDNVRYLPPQDRGWSYEDVKKKSAKVALPRPIPRVSFGTGYEYPGYGTIDQAEIPLELLEESGYPRNFTEVRVGIPFPRYGLYSLRNLCVKNAAGREVPAQFAELSRWPDGSLRFVLASFGAYLKAGEKAVWKLEAGKKVRNTTVRKGIQVGESAEKVVVDTGLITAEIGKKDFQLPVNLTCRGKKAGAFRGITLVLPDGKKLRSQGAPERIVVEEQGPEHVTILSEGGILPGGEHGSFKYQVRMRFRRGSAVIKMDVALIDADLDREYFDLREAYCEFVPAFQPGVISAGIAPKDGAKKVSIHGKAIRQMTWDTFYHNAAKRQGTLESWFALTSMDRKTRVSVAISDAAKRWPKGLSMTEDAFRIELLPPLPDKKFGLDFPQHLAYCFCAGNHRMKWGMKFNTPILVDLLGGSLPILAADADLPVVAVLPPAWYEKCGVMPGANATVPGVDHRIDEMLKYNDLGAASDVESGYLNYGDWFGERRRNWGNNEYDTPYSYFSQFVRTGNRKLFRLGLAGAQHQADTDIAHAAVNPRILGGMSYHGIGHTGSADYAVGYWSPTNASFTGFPNNGHTWVRGMLHAWLLAGDARCMDSALLCGEQLYRQSWMQTAMASAPRVTGWMLVALSALYEAKPDPAYMTGAANLFETQFREQDFEHGGVWARRKKRLGDDKKGQTTFMLGVIGISMMQYHRISGDPRALKSLRYICDWLVGNFHPGEVGYYYDAEWNHKAHTFVVCFVGAYTGSVLMYTANATGEKKYVQVADQLLKMHLSRGFGVKKDMSMAMLHLNEWLGERKIWAENHPGDVFTYATDAWYREYMARQTPAFQARSQQPITFRLTLKKDSGSVLLRRTQLNVREAEIKLASSDGKVLFETKTGRDAKLNAWDIPFKGKAGDILTLTVADNDNAFWDLLPSDDYFAEAFLSPLYILRRPNIRRYYFRVPAGTKDFTVKLFPRNCGFVNGLVRRPDGSTAGFAEGCNYTVNGKLPSDPDAAKWWVKIPVSPKPEEVKTDAVWSIDYAACIDGGLALEGVPPYISIVPR